MSIQSEISRITGNIASAYTALSAKGATMPSVQNTANLKSTIEGLPEVAEPEAMSIETIRRICYVPSDFEKNYTAVSYIESSGTQYIDTGVYVTQDYRVECDVELTATVSTATVFGHYISTSDRFAVHAVSSATKWRAWASGIQQDLTESCAGRHIIKLDSSSLTTSTGSLTFSGAAFTATIPMYIFALNHTGAVKYPTSMRLYSFKVYNGDQLVRDYVPCYKNSTGVVGLYDMANKKFYANAGTGSFAVGDVLTAPPDGYTQLSYIQSDGTQYINTGFKPTYQSRLVMDMEGLGTDTRFIFGVRTASTTAASLFTLYRSSATAIRTDYFGTNQTLTISDASVRTTVDKNQNVTTMFGSTLTNTAVTSGSCDYELYLFALSTTGSVSSGKAAFKLYSCQIYDNGALLRYFVPCKNADGVYGLYDKVNARFYPDAAGGNFTGA